MRLGCVVVLAAVVMVAMATGSLWVGSRMLQEPVVDPSPGTAEDGVRGQQKIYDIARGVPGRTKGRPLQVSLTEPELNAFLSRHLTEAARIPVVTGGVRLVGDGIIEFKGQLPLRQVLTSLLFVPVVDLIPGAWLERSVWLHLGARASLEVGAARGQRRFLRLDVERFALGRQPLPEMLLRLLLGPETMRLFRWHMPEAVEAITIEPGMVVIRTAAS